MTIEDYVLAHTERGECRCGRCVDAKQGPDRKPNEHTADTFFFQVTACNEPTRDEFLNLTRAHRGVFCECDPVDGKEHSYLELGGWIGDQGLALQYMGLGAVLGVFSLLTPKLLPISIEVQQQLAGAGMVAIQAKAV